MREERIPLQGTAPAARRDARVTTTGRILTSATPHQSDEQQDRVTSAVGHRLMFTRGPYGHSSEVEDVSPDMAGWAARLGPIRQL